MLRVHDRRLFRRETEKSLVEHLEPVQWRTVWHVVAVAQQARIFARGAQVFLGIAADRGDAVAQVAPVGMDIRRTRKMRRHADDGDVGFAILKRVIRHSYPARTVRLYPHGEMRVNCGGFQISTPENARIPSLFPALVSNPSPVRTATSTGA